MIGYRAPCFSLDRERLDLVEKSGFEYDSSRIDFSMHPLYGTIKMDDYLALSNNIFRKNNFFEFQVSTLSMLKRTIPVSGGGYIRIFPWIIMKRLVQKYIMNNDLYILYIHPFELSNRNTPSVPDSTSWKTKFRFGYGRDSVSNKINLLIRLLKDNGYQFVTFSELKTKLLD